MLTPTKFDLFHMDTAIRASKMSYAKRLQVGAVAARGVQLLSYGYNGTLPGKNNTCEGVNPDGTLYTLDTVIHAEENLLIKMAMSNESISGCTVYITHAPCIKCARMLCASNISRLVYKDVYRDAAGLNLLSECGISVQQYKDGFLI